MRFHSAPKGVALQLSAGDRFVCDAQLAKRELVVEKSIWIRLVAIVRTNVLDCKLDDVGVVEWQSPRRTDWRQPG